METERCRVGAFALSHLDIGSSLSKPMRVKALQLQLHHSVEYFIDN